MQEPKRGSHRDVALMKDLAPWLWVDLLGDRLQLSSLSGLPSTAESHLARGHALLRVTHDQWQRREHKGRTNLTRGRAALMAYFGPGVLQGVAGGCAALRLNFSFCLIMLSLHPLMETGCKDTLTNSLNIHFHLGVGVLVNSNSRLMHAGVRWDFGAGLFSTRLVIRIHLTCGCCVTYSPGTRWHLFVNIFTRSELGCYPSRKECISWRDTSGVWKI